MQASCKASLSLLHRRQGIPVICNIGVAEDRFGHSCASLMQWRFVTPAQETGHAFIMHKVGAAGNTSTDLETPVQRRFVTLVQETEYASTYHTVQ